MVLWCFFFLLVGSSFEWRSSKVERVLASGQVSDRMHRIDLSAILERVR